MFIRRALAPLRTTSLCSAFNSSSIKFSPKLSLVQHPFPINGTPIEAGPSKPDDMFAVVEFSGRQYKVTLDDVIVADKIDGLDIGQKVDLDKVLLVGSRKATVVGRPLVEGAQVIAAVEEITRDKKVISFKMRRRKNSKRTKGFRRQVTILRVTDIILGKQLEEQKLTESF